MKIKNLIVLFFTLLLAISCGKKSDEQRGIVVNLDAEPRTIDPTMNNQNYVSVYLFHAFEGLTRKDKDNKLAGGVAESWDISPDGKKYTFHLRKDAKWSDGENVVANDFVYAWRRAVDPKVAAPYSYMFEIVKNGSAVIEGKIPIERLGVKAIDDYTLEVELENPTAYFLEFISTTTCFLPVRKDIIEKYGDKWTDSAETYISNGPYKLTEREMDVKLVFELSDNYWAKDEMAAKKITFLMMADTAALIASLKNGTLDFGVPPAGEIEKLKKDGYVVDSDAFGTFYYVLNITNKGLDDKRIRRALSLAIDRNYIVENITKGGQKPAAGFVPYKMNDANGEFRASAKNSFSTKNEDYQKNIEEAKALMAEAGYPEGKGFPVIELKVTSGMHSIVAEAAQQMWKENLGIDVMLSQEEFATTLGKLKDGSFQMARMGWTGDFNDPMTMLDIFTADGAMNFGRWNNAEYNKLIALAKKSSDNQARAEAFHKAEEILIDDMAIIPLYYRADSWMINPKLEGYILDPLGRHKFGYSYVK